MHHGNGTSQGAEPRNCDNDNNTSWSRYTSPDWVGAGWYRFMVGTSSRIPESPPGSNQCGTHATGWLKGSHPAVAGQTKEVKFCFDGKGWGYTDCIGSTQGKVTHCRDYFVYYLENTQHCFHRYCATDRF